MPWASLAPLWHASRLSPLGRRSSSSPRECGAASATPVGCRWSSVSILKPESGRPQERARVIDAAHDGDAILTQYAEIRGEAIQALPRLE
jgi:hypothetical protein